MWDREMAEALRLDAEKLAQLTGEDHGPWTLAEYFGVEWEVCPECEGAGEWMGSSEEEVTCPKCEGAGRVYHETNLVPEPG